MAKPRAFVSSTFYDLKYIRDNIQTFLIEKGFEPLLNEKGNIPYDKSITLQSNCLEEIISCDILIGIIGNRFGTESEFDHEKSISMNEIQTAWENNKQIFLFVEQDTWHENDFYEKNINNDTVAYKADVKIHRFISEIKQKKQNNALHPFTSANDITNFLQEQFTGILLRWLRNSTKDGLRSGINIPAINVGKTKEVIQLTEKYQDRKYGFSFHYPQDWKVLPNPVGHVLVAGQPNNGFAPNITVEVRPLSNDIFQLTLSSLQKQYELLHRNVKIKDFGITKIGDTDCLRSHVQLTIGEALHLEILQLFFLHKGKTFVLTAADKQSNFGKNINIFNDILASLQFGKMKGKKEKEKLRKEIEKSLEIKEEFQYYKKYYRSDCYYEFMLIKLNNQYFLSDQGKTYEMLDKIFELKEPDVIKNLQAVAKECEVVITEDDRLVISLDFWNDSPNEEQKQLLEEAKSKLFTCVAFMDTMHIFYR